ncbi:MAG: hypothetical protein CME68_10075 [Halobacteriovoraceae bacterium]|nr:hypothetical protein [Halobacteriovoraceae bacterium]
MSNNDNKQIEYMLLEYVTRNFYHQSLANKVQQELMSIKDPRELSTFKNLNQLKTSYSVNTWQELYLKFVSYHHDKEQYYENQLQNNLDLHHIILKNIKPILKRWVTLSKSYGGEPRKAFDYNPHLPLLSYIAAESGFFKSLEIFLKVSKYSRDIIKDCLHKAAEKHQYQIVKMLLDNVKNPNDITDQDELLSWSIENNDFEVLQKLLDIGVSPNRKKNNNKSPLALATFKENIEMIKILLNKGADINILGCYPLISAIGRRNMTIIEILLETNKIKKKNLESAIAITKGKIGTKDIMDMLVKALEKAPL